ncbi:AAA family ATPase [Oerskovia sp. NPDC060338]|uniref:AAA family ATPase n=1 Tax=Oerskovia sp. NPDC060338 TaxID=3347100 RepID=UPI003669EC1D
MSTPMMRALAAAIAAKTPVLIWGEPGVGKTATIEKQFSQRWGFHVETIIGSLREATDFLGLPIETDGEVHYSTPAWTHRLNAAQGPALLYLDELTSCATTVRKAMLRVVQERQVGETWLGDNVSIVASANPVDSAVDGWELAPPEANRFMHLDWHFNADQWLEGLVMGFDNTSVEPFTSMVGAGDTHSLVSASALIATFVEHNRMLLNPGPPADQVQAGLAWASPRSWHNAARVLGHLRPGDDDAALLVIAGCVGKAAATSFFAWRATMDLVDPALVLADPNAVKWGTERPDRLYVLCRSLAAIAVAEGTRQVWTQAARALTVCAESGKVDVALPSVRTLLTHMPADATVPDRMRNAFADLLGRAGRWAVAA